MAKTPLTLEEAIAENEALRARLEEAEAEIRAIQSGEVDAVVVTGPDGEQIYTLMGAERTYRILVEAMCEGALVLSPKGVIIYSNRTFAAMLGAPIYDVLGHPIYDFVADADVEPLMQMLEQAPLRTNRREINLKHTDAGDVPAFVSVGHLDSDEGPSVSAVVMDLTEHKRTEAELTQYREHLEELVVKRTQELAELNSDLADSERHVVNILESINDAFIAVGKDWRFTYINAAAQRDIYSRVGREREDLIGKDIWEEFPDLRDTVVYECYCKAMLERVAVSFEFFYSQLQTWFGINVYPYEDGICAYCQDITERRRAEDSLKKYGLLSQHARDIVLFVARDGLIVEANQAAVEAYGYAREELLSLSIFDLRAADPATGVKWQMTAADASGILFEAKHRRKDGSLFDVEVNSCGADIGGERVLLSIIRDITDRKQAEEALRESEERLQNQFEELDNLYKYAPVALFVLDRNLIFLRANERLAENNGIPLDAILGHSLYDVLPGEMVERLKKAWAPVFEKGEPVLNVEMTGQTAKLPGVQRYWLDSYYPLKSETGEVIAVAGSVLDITERKQAEEALHASRNKLLRTLESITDGFLSLDHNWRFTYFNKTGVEMIGMRVADLIGSCVWEVFPDALDSKFYTEYHRAVSTGKPVHFEEYYPTPLEKWFECHCYPSEEGLSVYFRDITERKRAEEALRESEERFRTMANAIPQLAWMADPDGFVFWYNQRWYEYTGTTPEEMEGWGWQSVHDPEILPAVLNKWKSSIERGEQFEMEFPLRRADGVYLVFLTRGTPLKDSEGRVVRWFGTNTDVSAARAAEAALIELQRKTADSLALLDTIQSMAPTGMAFVDREFRYVRVNEELAITNGVSVADHIGRTVEEIVPNLWPTLKPIYLRILDGESLRNIEVSGETQARPGEMRHWLVSYYPVCVSDEVSGVGMIVFDITKRKRLEEELRLARQESEEYAARLMSFITTMADGVTLFDEEGRLLIINDAGKKIFGVTSDSEMESWMSGFQWFNLEGEPLSADKAGPYRALHGEILSDYRYRVMTPWGKSIVLSVSGSPVRDSEGRIVGATTIFRDVANRVEYELDREESLKRERHIAQVLQEALVPPSLPANIHGFKFGVKYRPALKEAEVGGDFYDIFELVDGKLGVVIGDVAGKGLGAAIRVAAARYSIRSYAFIDPRPSVVMTLANAALCKEVGDETSMLTAFFAVIDTRLGSVTYSSAGHESPLVCRRTGVIEELGIGGMPLGVMEDAEYSQDTIKLQPGDTIVMVTDGITEARAPGVVLFEKKGMIEYLVQNTELAPQEKAIGLLDAATAHAGGRLQDDAALVVFQYESGEDNGVRVNA